MDSRNEMLELSLGAHVRGMTCNQRWAVVSQRKDLTTIGQQRAGQTAHFRAIGGFGTETNPLERAAAGQDAPQVSLARPCLLAQVIQCEAAPAQPAGVTGCDRQFEQGGAARFVEVL